MKEKLRKISEWLPGIALLVVATVPALTNYLLGERINELSDKIWALKPAAIERYKKLIDDAELRAVRNFENTNGTQEICINGFLWVEKDAKRQQLLHVQQLEGQSFSFIGPIRCITEEEIPEYQFRLKILGE